MSVRFCVHVALTVVTAALLASCADHRHTAPLPVHPAIEPPPMLLSIDQRAQQIVRLAPTGDWPQIDAYIADIDDAWARYVDTAVKPAPQSESAQTTTATLEDRVAATIGELKEAAAKRDAPATTTTADRLDVAVVSLYENLHAAVSPNLRRLEVLERQILIDLSSDAYNSAMRTVDSAEAVWHRVQPRIQIRAGYEAAVTLDGQFVVQRTALEVRDRTTVIASVQTVLSLIDDIQNLY